MTATYNAPRSCDHCSVVFIPKSPKKTRRFCSRSCAGKSSAPQKGSTNAGSFNRGLIPWNKGIKGWNAGHVVTDATKAKLASRTGPSAGGWRGGVSKPNELARKGTAYKTWRKAVFDRDGYQCQGCGAKSVKGDRVTLHADHIKPFATHHELRYDVSNGRTLCVPCHKKTPTYGASIKKLTGGKAVKG